MTSKKRTWNLLKLAALTFFAATMSISAPAADFSNTVTFSNLSGDGAAVKLIGPVRMNVNVPNGTQTTVNVPPGTYYFLVRYCGNYGECYYAQGDPFEVVQTSTEYSVITITLHLVPDGNYHERPSSRADFDRN